MALHSLQNNTLAYSQIITHYMKYIYALLFILYFYLQHSSIAASS